MKKTYDVEVDCANCAAKMEEAVKNTEGSNRTGRKSVYPDRR